MSSGSTEKSSLIARVIVGSHLHGLADESSDLDLREVRISPLLSILSPFSQPPKLKPNELGDIVCFELRRFIKHAVQGNPTMLEILWSTEVLYQHPLWELLVKHREKVLDSRRIYAAHVGYFNSQMSQIKSLGFGSDTQESNRRRGKLTAATLRVLTQGHDLIAHKTFTGGTRPRPDLGLSHYAQLLINAKKGLTHEEFQEYYLETIEQLNNQMTSKYHSTASFLPDIEWLEQFILDAYLASSYIEST